MYIGLTKEEIKAIENDLPVAEERRAEMRSLPAGSPLGIDYSRSNHCYIAAPLQILSNSPFIEGNYHPLVDYMVNTYCQTMATRREGEDAVVHLETELIEHHVLNSYFKGDAQGELFQILPNFFQNQQSCAFLNELDAQQLASIDPSVCNTIVVHTRQQVTLPRKLLDNRYYLTGVIVHTGKQNAFGTADSGHYVAYIVKRNKFFCCNGSMVKEVTKEEVQRATQGPAFRFYARGDCKTLSEMAKEVLDNLNEMGAEKGLLSEVVGGYATANHLSSTDRQALENIVRQHL